MPAFTDSTINAIKARLTMSEVVQWYIPVIQKGGRPWAKCPFHGGGNERTPSFVINDKDGFYHCFGCGESGDMFTFIEKMEHMSFPEAVEMLASKAGVEIMTESGRARKEKGETDILLDLNQRLQGSFHHMLLHSKEGERAREYLSRRRVSPEMIERFCLGYAPRSTDWLHSFLIGKGYSDEMLRKSGLFSANHYPYPLFADRLIFPVRNRQGRTIAFSGRDLSGRENAPKYVNSPETQVYSKRHNCFGLYEAFDGLKKEGSKAILVEGNFDVIAMHQAGLATAVAPLGTAFTEEQADLLSRYCSRIDLLFDSDGAGAKATDKAISIIHPKGLDCFVHGLRRGKDASEIIEKLGEKALLEDFNTAESAFDYLVNKTAKSYDIRTPRGKSGFVRAISSFLESTASNVERESYILSLSTYLSVPEETIREDISGSSAGRRQREDDARVPEQEPVKRFNSAAVSIDLYAMLFLANHRDLFRQYRSRISFGDLRDREAQDIYMALENAMRSEISSNELFLSLISDERARNDTATSFGLDEYRNGKVSALDEATDRIALRGLEEQRLVLTNQLRSFSDSLDGEQITEALERKAELDRKIIDLKAGLYGRSANEDED